MGQNMVLATQRTKHLYNVEPTSKTTLGRRCTSVIQMFCVCLPTSIPYLQVNRAARVSLDVPRTHDVDLVPIQFRFNVGPVSQPISGSMPTNCLRRWPNTTPRLGLLFPWY